MPLIRCMFYNDDGVGTCKKGGACQFVHPSSPQWDRAPKSRALMNKGSFNRKRREPDSGRGYDNAPSPLSTTFGTGANSWAKDSGWKGSADGWGSTADAPTGWKAPGSGVPSAAVASSSTSNWGTSPPQTRPPANSAWNTDISAPTDSWGKGANDWNTAMINADSNNTTDWSWGDEAPTSAEPTNTSSMKNKDWWFDAAAQVAAPAVPANTSTKTTKAQGTQEIRDPRRRSSSAAQISTSNNADMHIDTAGPTSAPIRPLTPLPDSDIQMPTRPLSPLPDLDAVNPSTMAPTAASTRSSRPSAFDELPPAKKRRMDDSFIARRRHAPSDTSSLSGSHHGSPVPEKRYEYKDVIRAIVRAVQNHIEHEEAERQYAVNRRLMNSERSAHGTPLARSIINNLYLAKSNERRLAKKKLDAAIENLKNLVDNPASPVNFMLSLTMGANPEYSIEHVQSSIETISAWCEAKQKEFDAMEQVSRTSNEPMDIDMVPNTVAVHEEPNASSSPADTPTNSHDLKSDHPLRGIKRQIRSADERINDLELHLEDVRNNALMFLREKLENTVWPGQQANSATLDACQEHAMYLEDIKKDLSYVANETKTIYDKEVERKEKINVIKAENEDLKNQITKLSEQGRENTEGIHQLGQEITKLQSTLSALSEAPPPPPAVLDPQHIYNTLAPPLQAAVMKDVEIAKDKFFTNVREALAAHQLQCCNGIWTHLEPILRLMSAIQEKIEARPELKLSMPDTSSSTTSMSPLDRSVEPPGTPTMISPASSVVDSAFSAPTWESTATPLP